MFVGSNQSLSELTFTDERAKDNGPSGAHSLLSSAPTRLWGARRTGSEHKAAPITDLHRGMAHNPPTVFKKAVPAHLRSKGWMHRDRTKAC